MTLRFYNESLSLYPENIRALEFRKGNWTLIVANPRGIGINEFTLEKTTLHQFVLDRACQVPENVELMTIERAEELFTWLLTTPKVFCKPVSPVVPDFLPLGRVVGAARNQPGLNQSVPKIER